MKTNNKHFALSLAFLTSFKATPKWPIEITGIEEGDDKSNHNGSCIAVRDVILGGDVTATELLLVSIIL